MHSDKDTDIKLAYTPPKPWPSLTDSEKIERMRGIIKSLQDRLFRQERTSDRLFRKLSRHQHKDGKVVETKEILGYDDEGSYGGLTASTPNVPDTEVYF